VKLATFHGDAVTSLTVLTNVGLAAYVPLMIQFDKA
jgi:hypothetical protein